MTAEFVSKKFNQNALMKFFSILNWYVDQFHERFSVVQSLSVTIFYLNASRK